MKNLFVLAAFLGCVSGVNAQECGRLEYIRGTGFDPNGTDQLAGIVIRADVPARGVLCYSVPIHAGQGTEVRLLSGAGIVWSWNVADPREETTQSMTAGTTIFEMTSRGILSIAQVAGATKAQRIKFSILTSPNRD